MKRSCTARNVALVAALCAAATLVTPSVRAQQASADAELSIVRSELALISDVDDWVIGLHPSAATLSFSDFSDWDWQCVYTTTGLFGVEVTSANGGSRLHLRSGADELDYHFYTWYRQGATYPTYAVGPYSTPSVTIGNLSGSLVPDCSDEAFGNSNLWFIARVYPADFNAAPPGIYRDVMTITVTPE